MKVQSAAIHAGHSHLQQYQADATKTRQAAKPMQLQRAELHAGWSHLQQQQAGAT